MLWGWLSSGNKSSQSAEPVVSQTFFHFITDVFSCGNPGMMYGWWRRVFIVIYDALPLLLFLHVSFHLFFFFLSMAIYWQASTPFAIFLEFDFASYPCSYFCFDFLHLLLLLRENAIFVKGAIFLKLACCGPSRVCLKCNLIAACKNSSKSDQKYYFQPKSMLP